MRSFYILVFLVLATLAVATLERSFAIRRSISLVLKEQLRTPDLANLVSLLGSHDQTFSLLTVVILATLLLLAAFLLRLLQTDKEVRKRLTAALEAKAAADSAWRQLDEAIETLSEGFVLYDDQDRLVRANSKYLEIYAASAEWIVPGATFEDIIRRGAYAGQYDGALENPEPWVQDRMQRRRAMRERAALPFEQHLADGRWLIVSDRAISTGGMVGIRTDITELKRNVAALEHAREGLRLESARAQELADANRQAHKLLDDAIAAISEGFALWDAEDRLVTCNSRYRNFCAAIAHLLEPGVHYAHFIRASIKARQIEPVREVETMVAARMRRRRNGSPEGYIEHLGDGRWIKVTNRPVDGGGIVTVFSDISEIKLREIELTKAHNTLEVQAENMRQLMELAEAANRAKSGFLAMISHEIRTPMNAVLGLSGLLAETTLDAEQRSFVEAIEESGGHLVSLINDLLDFTRLEAEKTQLDLAPASLRELMAGATRMMRVLAQKKGINLHVEIQPDLPDGIEIDAARFNQVLINLIGNAIKFTQRGSVTLTVQGRTKGGHLMMHLSVADTGSGVPPDMRQRLFTPFERAMVHDRGQVSGTGLGLAITARLLHLMGGTISLRENGPGATFDIALEVPLAKGGALRKTAAPPDTVPIGAMRVLVAEDTPASQLVIRTLLERRGHRVELVADGERALEEASLGGFDLVLLDIQMPKKSGFEVVRAIRNLPEPLCHVPVVALSALAFPADRLASLEVGFNEHLGKPLSVADLDRLIARLALGDFEPAPPCEVEEAVHMPDVAGGALGGNPQSGDIRSIDHAIAELRGMCEDEVVGELIDLALMNIASEQEILAAAGLEADYDRMRKAAHKLSGVLAQYGAREAAHLAAAFERAEEAVMRADLPEFEQRIEAAHGLLQAARERVAA